MSRLFDDFERADPRPGKHSERTYEFLNRVQGPVWDRVRDLIDEWFERHPSSAQASIEGRMRRGDNDQFRAAFFELYGGEVLRRIRENVQEHPQAATGRQPDLLATSPGIPPLVLELTSTGASKSEKAGATRLNRIYDGINSLEIEGFLLHVEIHRFGDDDPPLGRLKRELLKWIEGLDIDREWVAFRDGAGDYLTNPETERYRWFERGWELEFRPIPSSPEARSRSRRAIGVYPVAGGWVNDVDPIKRRLRDKASAYGDFDGPFVVGVMLNRLGSDDLTVGAALYGDEAYRFPVDDFEAGAWLRSPNGSWFGPTGWRNTHVSGVLAVMDLSPWSVTTTVPTLWHHPLAQFPVDQLAPIFRQAIPNPETGAVEFVEPTVGPASFFELAADWPGPEPPFSRD